MFRTFFILAVVVFLGQATGIVAFVAGAECTENCPDDRLDNQCSPLCVCSTCNAHHRPLAPVERVTLPGQPFLQRVPLQSTQAPASPTPFKIFHVPKRPLA
jgi:hypothetical protein